MNKIGNPVCVDCFVKVRNNSSNITFQGSDSIDSQEGNSFNIYKPEYPRKPDKLNGTEIGKTKIISRNSDNKFNRYTDAVITCDNIPNIDGAVSYYLHAEGKKVGNIRLVDVPDGTKPYGTDGKKLGHLEIYTINSFRNDKYKGIGTILIQTAIEESKQKNHEGRVQVFAADVGEGSPIGFYFKNKFRSCNPDIKDSEVKEELLKAKEKNNMEDFPIESLEMYLPEKEIKQYWDKIIEKNPILNQNSK